MAQKLYTSRMPAVLMLMFFSGAADVRSAPLPLPPGPLDTNVFNTNGLVLSPDVQFLLRDLQTNLAQARPFLDMVASTNRSAPGNAISSPDSPAAFTIPRTVDSKNAPVIYGLGAALENVQTDLQELLPKLAAMVGQTNYTSGSVTNNSPVPNRLDPPVPVPARSPEIERTGAPVVPAPRMKKQTANGTTFANRSTMLLSNVTA